MSIGIDVKINNIDYLSLGGESNFDWRQHNVSGPYWRLYWNSIAGALVKVDGKEVELTPGRLVMLSPGTVYSTRTACGVKHLYFHFTTGHPFSDVQPQMFVVQQPELCQRAKELAMMIQTDRSSYRTEVSVQILIMSALLALPQKVVPPKKDYDPRIAKILDMMAANALKGNLQLADAVNMSVNNFLLLFRNEMGSSPQTYFRRRRLEAACNMLDSTNSSIDEIAIDAGFYDRYHFSRAFKKEYGISPAKYRKHQLLLTQSSEV